MEGRRPGPVVMYRVGKGEKCIIWNYDIFGLNSGRTKQTAILWIWIYLDIWSLFNIILEMKMLLSPEILKLQNSVWLDNFREDVEGNYCSSVLLNRSNLVVVLKFLLRGTGDYLIYILFLVRNKKMHINKNWNIKINSNAVGIIMRLRVPEAQFRKIPISLLCSC